MFLICNKKTYKWTRTTGKILINADHIIAVEESEDSTAIITCTGQNKEDEVLYYHLENTYDEVLGMLAKGRKL